MLLELDDIQRYIPHRDDMLFARRVRVLTHDHYQGEALWHADSFVFRGHFPGTPVVPGVMVVEAAAQIAGAGLRAGDPVARASAAGNVGLLAGIRKCFFHRPVTPGLLVSFDLYSRQIAEGAVQVKGEASCERGNVATLEFVFVQAPEQALQQLLDDVATLNRP